MLKDKIITGTLIGILADGFKLISNYIMYLMGLTDIVFWQIAASRFLSKEDLLKPAALFIGAIADITVTSFLGVVFILIIYFFSKDYIWIKGIGFAMFVWVSLFGTLLSLELQNKIPQKISGIIVTIIAHFIYGLGFALFTSILYNEEKRTK